MLRSRPAKTTTLRRTVDLVTVAAALGLVGGLGYYQFERSRVHTHEVQVADDLRRFEQMVQLRAATKDVELNGRGWPLTIDPEWFGDAPPRNLLLSPDRPWVEVAQPEEAELRDPVDRVALDDTLASFWYNPYQGVVRARVPLRINDEQTLALYNRVNATALDSIYSKVRPQSATAGAPAPESGAHSPAVPPTATPTTTVDATPAPSPTDEMTSEALDPTKPLPPADPPPSR